MGLIKELLLLPAAPVRFPIWVAEKVTDEGCRQQYSSGAIVQQIDQIEEVREKGELGEQEAEEIEGEIIEQRVGRVGPTPSERKVLRVGDEKLRREQRKPDEEGSSNGERRPSRQGRLSKVQLAQRARRQLAEITGLEAESVIAFDRAGDTWRVTVELLELSRMPETDDLLGIYEADLDENGELLRYRRLSRYPRSKAGEERVVEGGK